MWTGYWIKWNTFLFFSLTVGLVFIARHIPYVIIMIMYLQRCGVREPGRPLDTIITRAQSVMRFEVVYSFMGQTIYIYMYSFIFIYDTIRNTQDKWGDRSEMAYVYYQLRVLWICTNIDNLNVVHKHTTWTIAVFGKCRALEHQTECQASAFGRISIAHKFGWCGKAKSKSRFFMCSSCSSCSLLIEIRTKISVKQKRDINLVSNPILQV